MLFTQFGINYNKIEEVYKRGTTLIRVSEDPKEEKKKKKQPK